jgi:hypothetical protein
VRWRRNEGPHPLSVGIFRSGKTGEINRSIGMSWRVKGFVNGRASSGVGVICVFCWGILSATPRMVFFFVIYFIILFLYITSVGLRDLKFLIIY